MLMVMPKIIVAIPFSFTLFIMLRKSNGAARISSIMDATLLVDGQIRQKNAGQFWWLYFNEVPKGEKRFRDHHFMCRSRVGDQSK